MQRRSRERNWMEIIKNPKQSGGFKGPTNKLRDVKFHTKRVQNFALAPSDKHPSCASASSQHENFLWNLILSLLISCVSQFVHLCIQSPRFVRSQSSSGLEFFFFLPYNSFFPISFYSTFQMFLKYFFFLFSLKYFLIPFVFSNFFEDLLLPSFSSFNYKSIKQEFNYNRKEYFEVLSHWKVSFCFRIHNLKRIYALMFLFLLFSFEFLKKRTLPLIIKSTECWRHQDYFLFLMKLEINIHWVLSEISVFFNEIYVVY